MQHRHHKNKNDIPMQYHAIPIQEENNSMPCQKQHHYVVHGVHRSNAMQCNTLLQNTPIQ